ncbi:hypothetical protein BDV96DRAFT_286464 [Lophiotrema nucula]|uniref:Zn(2)-C6 fungal-type domain-containing protein n=1 Tax=Lophiotrema nucula TaxID=690887 RepID=A0A6A5YL45_9PLEO|nr:hypothetical protein BDV96DRAFT_286464 [Lophiotrema nucula]
MWQVSSHVFVAFRLRIAFVGGTGRTISMNRATYACARCFRQKRKCDSRSPCTRCLQAGVECVGLDRATATPVPRRLVELRPQIWPRSIR